MNGSNNIPCIHHELHEAADTKEAGKPCIFARYMTKCEPIAGVIKYAANVLILRNVFKELQQQDNSYPYKHKMDQLPIRLRAEYLTFWCY